MPFLCKEDLDPGELDLETLDRLSLGAGIGIVLEGGRGEGLEGGAGAGLFFLDMSVLLADGVGDMLALGISSSESRSLPNGLRLELRGGLTTLELLTEI